MLEIIGLCPYNILPIYKIYYILLKLQNEPKYNNMLIFSENI